MDKRYLLEEKEKYEQAINDIMQAYIPSRKVRNSLIIFSLFGLLLFSLYFIVFGKDSLKHILLFIVFLLTSLFFLFMFFYVIIAYHPSKSKADKIIDNYRLMIRELEEINYILEYNTLDINEEYIERITEIRCNEFYNYVITGSKKFKNKNIFYTVDYKHNYEIELLKEAYKQGVISFDEYKKNKDEILRR